VGGDVTGGPADRRTGGPVEEPRSWQRRAADAVAGFTSTRSKGMDAMFGGPPDDGVTHMVRAQGARVWTTDGRALIDWTMALGAVSLGYGYPRVAEAVARAARDGGVGPLPPALEVEAAERLCAGYPGAQQARFFKTGAEAVQAAVRIARVATGRHHVVHCGYHGWLDGPTLGAGVPPAVSGLWRAVSFGEVAQLRAAVTRETAAVVLEPFIEREPPREWLDAAREACEATGAVLIFDEIKTAFRVARGGGAERWGVAPDLAVLGKALANGAPLAAVVGRADLMARVRDTWISSTLATEFTALAAALAVMDEWDARDVAGHIRHAGAALLGGLPAGPWTVAGVPEMFLLRFADETLERHFLLATAKHGVLLKRGAYNFPSLAHGDPEIRATITAVTSAAAELA
jgi:glutamate-1-semialdehyde 2,1-aminomutase